MTQNAGDAGGAGIPNPLKRKGDDLDPDRRAKHRRKVIDLTGSDSQDSEATEELGPGQIGTAQTGTAEVDTEEAGTQEFDVREFGAAEIDPADSVLPNGFPAPLAAYVRGRAARIFAHIDVLPAGDGAGATHFAGLRQRYVNHPRVDRPLGGTEAEPGSPKQKLAWVAGDRAAKAVADEYNLGGIGDTWSGWWAPTGRASVPAPMVARRDLQLLSQLSQLLINDQHAAEKGRVAGEKEQAKRLKAQAQAREKARQAARGSSDEEMEVEVKVPAKKIRPADLTQEVEAMVVGDRILISANEQWAVDHLCEVDLAGLLAAKRTPERAGDHEPTWKERKERKIADLAAALAVVVEDEDDEAFDVAALSAAVRAGLARLVQLEVDCQIEREQRDAVKAILAVLREIVTGSTAMVPGGDPKEAKNLVKDNDHAGHLIVVNACVDKDGKAQTHAEQNIVYTALLADYDGSSAVAGGKRPCTVCWLTLRLARDCGHDVNFNWHPGGLWRGSTFRGLVQVADALGFVDGTNLRETVLGICGNPAYGLVQYVTRLVPAEDPAMKFELIGDLRAAVRGPYKTDVATQSLSESYHDLGSFSSQGGEDEREADEDEFSELWRQDMSEAEFEDDDEVESEGENEDEGDGIGEEAAYVYERKGDRALSGVAVHLELRPGQTTVESILREVIGLPNGPSSFGSAAGADIQLLGAPAHCFIAEPGADGVAVTLRDGKVSVRSADPGRTGATVGVKTVVRFGQYIFAGPYMLRFIKLDLGDSQDSTEQAEQW